MGPRDAGAVPLARLAELDSAAHHLREQTDMDRRAQAERNRSFDEKIDRIDQATQTNAREFGEFRAEMRAGVATMKWLFGVAIAVVPIGIGVAWTLARMIR